MKARKLSVLFCFISFLATAQIKPQYRAKVNPPKNAKKFWLFLLAGQSNMSGRGKVEPSDTIANEHVLTLNKNGQWEIAKDPIHFDRSYTGVGPGLTFGREISKLDTSVYVGLIPCAVGGSAINSWMPSFQNKPAAKNYAATIQRCKIAMKKGILKVIIWQQGESNCSENGVKNYQEKFKQVIIALRRDLGNDNLPFLAAILPEFQSVQLNHTTHQLEPNPYLQPINKAIKGLQGKIKNYNCISSANTVNRGDHLHYNTQSARLMGKRFAAKMKKYLKK